jgi:Acetoacetate decarboxylase (ADC)
MTAATPVPPPWRLRGDATLILYRRGVLAFIRYAESNVGPYQELLWLAPFRRGPAGRAHTIPQIFVSSEPSARSGRANWGLPKELAVFAVEALGPRSERVTVSRAGQRIVAFVRSWPRWALPLDATRIPARLRRLVQTSAGRRFETVPEGRGRCAVTCVSDLEVNGELLPEAQSSRWRLGLCLKQFELCFPPARISAGHVHA